MDLMLLGDKLVSNAVNGLLSEDRTRRVSGIESTPARAMGLEEAAIAAFIRSKGITRCPTAYAVPTRGSVTPADQAALERYAVDRERLRQQRNSGAAPFFLGARSATG